MWGKFPKVIEKVFPNAQVVIDRFHVMKVVNPHSAPSTVTRAFPCSFAIETAPLVNKIKYKYLIYLTAINNWADF